MSIKFFLICLFIVIATNCGRPVSAPTVQKDSPQKTSEPTKKSKEFAELALKTEEIINAQLKEIDAKAGLPRVVGLNNCGNTCYMNSLLQALLHSDLGKYSEVPFDNINFAAGINKNESLFKLFYDLASEYRKSTSAISTQKIAAARSIFMPSLEPGEQADANEYLYFFLARISTELNVIPKPLQDNTASEREKANFEFKSNWLKAGENFDYSIIQALFGGFLKSILTKTNGNENITFDFFTTLTLNFPKSTQALSLEELLDNFSQEEKLIDSPGNESKKLLLYKAPRTLIIHLKRFEQQSSGRLEKINTKVSYPAQLTLNTPADGMQKYDLFALVLHAGSLQGGHYTAQIKTPDKAWFFVSDDQVSASDEASALKQHENAYMLFYKKQI